MRKVGIYSFIGQGWGRVSVNGIINYSRKQAAEGWEFPILGETFDDVDLAAIDEYQLDGLIARIPDATVLTQIEKIGIPTINLSKVNASTKVPTVIYDHFEAGDVAARHLLEKGITNFAYVKASNRPFSQQRYSGFRHSLAGVGECLYLERDLSGWKPGQALTPEIFMKAAEELSKLPVPVGVLVESDQAALLFMQALNRAGIKCPDEVAVVSVNNDEMFCHLCNLELSSVDIAPFDLGFRAAELLDRLFAGDKVPAETLIKPLGVVPRMSSDIETAGDSVLAEALRFIRSNVGENINVDDVVRRVGMSRRTVENRFRNKLNHSINDIIQYERLKLACRLLRETTLSVKRVAFESGFSSPQYFQEAFKKQHQTSPGQYRDSSRLG